MDRSHTSKSSFRLVVHCTVSFFLEKLAAKPWVSAAKSQKTTSQKPLVTDTDVAFVLKHSPRSSCAK